MQIEGEYEGKQVRITYDGEGKCHLYVRFIEPIDLVRVDDDFNNTRMLSAQLRCELGYKDSCDLLFKGEVPKTSGLWALNHDGYPGEHFIQLHWPERL